MFLDFVRDMLGGVLPPAYDFIAYILSGVVLLVFVAVILNLFFNSITSFFFKS